MKKIALVAGARPNFMKIAPILRVMEKDYAERIQPLLIHTGQHYDQNMSEGFFQSLGIRKPDYNLQVGSGSHADQTAAIMSRFEDVCEQEEPDAVVVVGDVNSTIAAGLVAKKMHMQLAHVEAGLRSRDRSMPEEINRLATDAITDIFFTTEKQGTENLIREGQAEEAIHFVGHVMIDNLYYQLEKLKQTGPSAFAEKLKQRLAQGYMCLTMHRPSNVDDKETMTGLVKALQDIAHERPILFPCHPRTRQKITDFSLDSAFWNLGSTTGNIDSGIWLCDPLDYNDFLYLWKDAACVLTDSGGLQEETTALQIPCLTLRENTERPITVEQGTNVLVGADGEKIKAGMDQVREGRHKKGKVPELWDGRASERIVGVLAGERG